MRTNEERVAQALAAIGQSQLGMTMGVKHAAQNREFHQEIGRAISQFLRGKWGNICQEDELQNDYSLLNEQRIVAVYPTSQGEIWIINESDRSLTTILFPSEY